VATKIVTKPTVEARVLESFITIGMELLDLHNLSGALVILSSLNSSPIARLKRTWEVSLFEQEESCAPSLF